MPVQPPGVWGIDLGQCGLKAIRLQDIDGQIVATAFDYVEHPKILSQPDADPDQLTREALDKFLSRNTLRGDIVAISVPGQSGLARFVKLPPVEEKKIADIVRFEAKQQIPFNLDEVVWDYQKIGSGAVTDGFAMETEIGLFAMKRDMVARYLQHFQDVNVDVHLVQMAPLALCNYLAFDLLSKDEAGEESGEKACVVALDIGADSSNLVITDGERIIWQRPIPLGGNHFTRALTKDLKLTFAKAEHLKRNATKSPDLKKILAALKPVLNDFVGEVQRSLGYFTNTHRDAHIEYMVGLGNAFRLPGLQKFLGEKLQLDVKKLAKMERVDGDQVVAQQAFTENILTFAVAYGLALQGLKRARLLTNLLPGEIRVERLIKAKKPFAVAAAAALLLAGGGLALSYALEFRTYGDKRVTDAIGQSKSAVQRATAAKNKFDAAVKHAKEEEEAVKTIVAGQFERDDWPQLYKFINAAAPRPDGSPREFLIPGGKDKKPQTLSQPNIPDEFEKKFWSESSRDDAVSGKEAYRKYLMRRAGGGGGGGIKDDAATGGVPNLGEGIEDFVQVNIEAVNAFFCDNLGAFWSDVKKKDRVKANGASLVRPKTDFDKNPSGVGWIVEIQGWTYHHNAEEFVYNTFLENIARLGAYNPPPKADPAAGGAAPPGAVPRPAPAAPPPVPGAMPGRAPGGPGQTASADAKLPDCGPVINHISHAVLYQWTQSAPKGAFVILDNEGQMLSDVKTLALAGTAPASGTGPAAMPSAPPPAAAPGGASGASKGLASPKRSEWGPLGTVVTKAGGVNGIGGIGGERPRGTPNRGKKTGMQPGTMRTPGDRSQKPASDVPEKGPKRTEFVILFIWKEPTRSDDLRGLAPAPEGGANPSAPGGGAHPPGGARHP